MSDNSCSPIGCPISLVSMQFVHRAPIFALVIAMLGFGYSSYAFVSLQTGALPLVWVNTNVSYVINAAADPQINDETDVTAVRLAFEEWDEIATSRISFLEDSRDASRGRSDWRSDNIHLVQWDTNNESGFFGPGSGLVAITPVDFVPSTGQILDADILFNAGGHSFTTSNQPGRFDVQSIATHEVGHFIGLDHTGIVAATMNPFANAQDTRLRSLAKDDIAAASAIYPMSGQPGEIVGSVKRNGQPVTGAHVIAENRDGEPASSCLSDAAGNFRIRGLDQGEYVVYAEPLDGPVTMANFSTHTSGLTINTNFGTTFWGNGGQPSSPANPQTVFVNFGQASNIGAINTLVRSNINVRSLSHTVVLPNSEQRFSIRGIGISRADSVVIPGPIGDALFISNPLPQDFTSGAVAVDLTVLQSALPQLRSVRVFNSTTKECSVLTGGFEVRMPGPLLEGLSVSTARPGDNLDISGANFQNGARVLIGATVVNCSGSDVQLSLTVPDLPNGTYDVAVENPDGQFIKQSGALTVSGSSATAPPPPPTSTGGGGSSGGGTQVSAGSGFPSSSGGGSGGGGGGGGCSLASAPSSGTPAGAFFVLLLGGLLTLRRRS